MRPRGGRSPIWKASQAMRAFPDRLEVFGRAAQWPRPAVNDHSAGSSHVRSRPAGRLRNGIALGRSAPTRGLRSRRVTRSFRRWPPRRGLDHQSVGTRCCYARTRHPRFRRRRNESGTEQPTTPLTGYQIVEITIASDSTMCGQKLRSIPLPAGYVPVSLIRGTRLIDPDPELALTTGDRVNLLTPVT